MNNKEQQIRDELTAVNEQLSSPDIYSSKDYPSIAKRQAFLESTVKLFTDKSVLEKKLKEAEQLIEYHDPGISQLAQAEVETLSLQLEKLNQRLRQALIPQDPNDERNAIVEIRAAAGGDEASLFAGELYRMYAKWAERHRFKIELVSESPSEVGGFKEIIFEVRGNDVYRVLKFEGGVHRVQRIPSTESQGRIHTSTATVAVLPEAQETDVEIDPSDLRIDVYRSSGHGGQSVNTTDSAVRITHIPTGIVVTCQDEKSQIKNKDKAMAVLRSRLLVRKLQEEEDQISNKRKSLIGNGDRSEKIRTYNFPQDRITDHRIGYSRSGIDSALDGNIDDITERLSIAEIELTEDD